MKFTIKKHFITTTLLLLIIHLGYFVYGFYDFKSLGDAYIYFTFYRFKFYDDVSISHFFITSIFLFFSTVFLIKKYCKNYYTNKQKVFIYLSIVSTVILSCTFFISFSLGQRAKIYTLLPEQKFNNDKKLLNILNGFLYDNTADKVYKSFDVENILYPKPYPVIKMKDSILNQDGSYFTEENYYSIDTIKLDNKTFNSLNKLATKTNEFFNDLDISQIDLKKNILSKKIINDSVEVVYKGREVYPDNDLCSFMMNSELFDTIKKQSVYKQRFESAKERYNLLYTYKIDSLKTKLDLLQNLLNKYEIEAKINSGNLAKEIINTKNSRYNIDYVQLNNYIDRPNLAIRFKTLNKLFYNPQYFHKSIRTIFITVTGSLSLLIILLFILFNKQKIKN